MTKLRDKVIWVTGASSGIGEALAHALAKSTGKLVISSRKEKDLRRVREGVRGEGDVLVLPLDLADGASLAGKVDAVLGRFGRIDVLVNNGGISQRSRVVETGMDVYRRLMEVNYFGTVALTKAVLPGMIRQGGGHIAVTSSLTGKFGTPLRSGYAASKHALHGFFETLRAELWREKIKVTIACPGFVCTNVSMNALTGDGSRQGSMDEAQANGIPPEACARRIVQAIEGDEEEVLIGGKEVMAAHIKRLSPALFSKMIRRAKVT
jgi:dehydrogenase/reductase SDR family protein 7B